MHDKRRHDNTMSLMLRHTYVRMKPLHFLPLKPVESFALVSVVSYLVSSGAHTTFIVNRYQL